MRTGKIFILIITVLAYSSGIILAQNTNGAKLFWENLQKHCGKSYEGKVTEGAANDDFRGKRLVMQVKSCDENTIKIPFHVGDDRSRTWILTYKNNRITLKHDHRHNDGSEDKVTQYGGTSTNSGFENIQVFPADQQTCDLIQYAANNVWWITLDDKTFSYNLRRIGSDRLFSVTFDLSTSTETPPAPWGWKD
jgi:hypothetical protein